MFYHGPGYRILLVLDEFRGFKHLATGYPPKALVIRVLAWAWLPGTDKSYDMIMSFQLAIRLFMDKVVEEL